MKTNKAKQTGKYSSHSFVLLNFSINLIRITIISINRYNRLTKLKTTYIDPNPIRIYLQNVFFVTSGTAPHSDNTRFLFIIVL